MKTLLPILPALFATALAAALFSPASAQPVPGQQCINLTGNWASNSDFAIGLQQFGCTLQSTFTRAAGFNHRIEGQCAGSQCTWSVFRHDLSSGCRTVLYGVATMLDRNHFQTIVTGSDGRCELPTNYTETRIYRRE